MKIRKNLTYKSINGAEKVLPIRVAFANRMFLRLRGLLGRDFTTFDILAITPCNSIHTMFMAYPIDAVFLDRKGKILKIVPDIKPWVLYTGAAKAWTVLELPAGKASEYGFSVGDTCTYY